MDGRVRKHRQTSPGRARVWTEPSPKQQTRKVPVVYYPCRNRHLEHPHFIEVPLSSSVGLYLRDVIDRLNVLRGRGMASMYSWSCKRSYKNGFVWHDLCEDDLILPTNGNEYVLKGSELLEESHSDRFHPTVRKKLQSSKQSQERKLSCSQEAASSSSGMMVVKGLKPTQEDEISPPLQRPSSSDLSPDSRVGNNPLCDSRSLTEYKVCKGAQAADASTQTEVTSVRRNKAPETCTRGVSTDDGSLDLECNENHENHIPQAKDNSKLYRDEISPPPSSSSISSGGKAETLESLIRADANKINSFRIIEEEDIRMPSTMKVKPAKMWMQLISCGSISVKDHRFGLVATYRPSFSHSKFPSPLFSNTMMLGELDCLSENPRSMGLRLEDKAYFSGSLIETNTFREEGDGPTVLKRSSSYNADRTCKTSESADDKERETDIARSKCIPQSIKSSLRMQPRKETMRSPVSEGPRISSAGAEGSQSISHGSCNGGSKRITDPSSEKQPSKRLDSFREEKVIKIEERLASGARVIIQSMAPCDEDEGTS
ncbi:protein SOSEKI 3-like [Macadamia integrifolia]|uniref:protein SOSEKI 3-like n=1 Tax=Macadamia integrifolia TaxID=60698 RepID=UPI001C4FBEE2|nr:protein SOSEKI 3-like [Macadamia integrifolia]XP_042503479.1 protein SOSEKI 3-like [Macadamia integrifolia]XP_042503480.1 protein SOSEKI 3-like [Macadamia integrifolia]